MGSTLARRPMCKSTKPIEVNNDWPLHCPPPLYGLQQPMVVNVPNRYSHMLKACDVCTDMGQLQCSAPIP